MEFSFEREVLCRIQNRPHLLPIFDHVYDIPRRLREYKPSLFVVVNAIRNMEKSIGVKTEDLTKVPHGVVPRWGAWFEVHDLEQQEGETRVLTVRYGALDERILRDLWRSDLRVQGRALFDEVDRHNQRLIESMKKDQRNFAGALARESRLFMARASWGPSIFGPH
jgi:hypothetical protein